MVSVKWSSLTLLAAVGVLAKDADPKPPAEASGSSQDVELKADFSTTFPDSDIFGVKLVNGRPTRALVEVTNHEDRPITIVFVSGHLQTAVALPEDAPPSATVLRNLTAVRYDVSVPAGEKETLPFSFTIDMMPQDLVIKLLAVVRNAKGQVFQLVVHTEAAAVVEPPTSIFDPQIIFLYLVVGGVFGAIIYFVYKTWIKAIFPTAPRRGFAKKTRRVEVEPTSGNESAGATVGIDKGYDQSWIPDHHMNRPSARRVKSSAKKNKVATE